MEINISVLWDVRLCSPIKINRCFGGICRLRLQSSACYMLYAGYLLGLLFNVEDIEEIFLRNVG
jgi:hypothetical protein